MATKKTAKKTTKKKVTRKTAQKPAAAQVSQGGEEKKAAGERGGKKKTSGKFSKVKLKRMVDKMLLQLADQVEEGECRITTSEGMKLIQLREALGMDKPMNVKVEWVEPKE